MGERDNARQGVRLVPRWRPKQDPLFLDLSVPPLTLEEVIVTNEDPDARYVAQVLVRWPGFRTWFNIVRLESAGRPLVARPQEIRRANDVWASNFFCSPAVSDAVSVAFVSCRASLLDDAAVPR